MIFDGRLLSEIPDKEIMSLVEVHTAERQHIEYKVTIDHKCDDDRFETLCDITSLANAGGGYLIVGIRDDGKGHAQKFESVHDPDRLIKSIQSLCLDYISERIEGLEIECRSIVGNNVILIRVPPSYRIPHMVSYKNNTRFVTRYNDGKREMTIGEIRIAFSDNAFARRLSSIEDGIKFLMSNNTEEKHIEMVCALEKREFADLEVTDGKALSEARSRTFLTEINEKPYFRISITPATTNKHYIDVESKLVMDLIQNPPSQRPSGWNMEHIFDTIRRFSEGLIRGTTEGGTLTLLENAHMEFSIPLDFSFSWNQPESEYKKHPLLYPYPVVEYPASFIRVYKQLIDITGLETSFFVTMQYFNIKGYILRPYRPQAIGFMMPRISPIPYHEKHLILPVKEIENSFNPDKVCFDLLKVVYASFGYLSDEIPFYNKEIEKFNFD